MNEKLPVSFKTFRAGDTGTSSWVGSVALMLINWLTGDPTGFLLFLELCFARLPLCTGLYFIAMSCKYGDIAQSIDQNLVFNYSLKVQ